VQKSIFQSLLRGAMVGALVLAGAVAPASAQQKRLPVKMAVAGINFIPYLPIALAKQLGEFEKAGLDVDMVSFKGGAPVATALIGGSIDVASGYYEHTIQFATKGKAVRSFVIATRLPGLALVVAPKHKDAVKTIKDLAGKRVGVSAPGSATDFMLKYVLRKNGVDPASVPVIGVGEPASTVAAIEQGQVDAALNGEPAITVLQNKYSDLPILVDTRTEAGTRKLFSGDYPAACLYAMSDWLDHHPEEARRLALALVSTLHWIATHSPEEIVAKMPKDIVGPDPTLYLEVVKHMMQIFSKNGLMTIESAQNPYNLLKQSNPEVAAAKIDIAATFTNTYAEAADKKLGLAH
jgi:NitT/TauT family transport system substrate-binding protein